MNTPHASTLVQLTLTVCMRAQTIKSPCVGEGNNAVHKMKGFIQYCRDARGKHTEEREASSASDNANSHGKAVGTGIKI